MIPSKDVQEFIELFLLKGVEFLLVGGYALAFHGAPRFTEDTDFLVHTTEENALRITEALEAFGVVSTFSREDFLQPQQVMQIGRPPNRIDILTSIDGVAWADAWATKTSVRIGEATIWAIGLERLIENKKASGRPQDLADVARLEASRKR